MYSVTSSFQLAGIPLGYPYALFDDYGTVNESMLPMQYFVDGDYAFWQIYFPGHADPSVPPPVTLPDLPPDAAKYSTGKKYIWIWQDNYSDDYSNPGMWTIQSPPSKYSGWAIQHGVTLIEGNISAGVPLPSWQMAFLEGQNNYGRGSSIAPSGWIPDKAVGNQADIWNDFVARIEDLESPGDFLGINGIGTVDDWGPTMVIVSAVTGGIASAYAGAAEAAATETAITAADTAGGLSVEFGTSAAYEAGIASTTVESVEAIDNVLPEAVTISSESASVTIPSGIAEVPEIAIPELNTADLIAIENANSLPAAVADALPEISSGIVEVQLPALELPAINIAGETGLTVTNAVEGVGTLETIAKSIGDSGVDDLENGLQTDDFSHYEDNYHSHVTPGGSLQDAAENYMPDDAEYPNGLPDGVGNQLQRIGQKFIDSGVNSFFNEKTDYRAKPQATPRNNNFGAANTWNTVSGGMIALVVTALGIILTFAFLSARR